MNARGQVSATNPDDDRLLAAQVFQLSANDAADLLGLLGEAEAHEHSSSSASADQSELEITTAAPQQGSSTTHEIPKPRAALASQPISLTVLGPPQLSWRTADQPTGSDITPAFSPRQLDLLVFLAIHPDGVHRDTLLATLWAGNAKATNAMNTALSRLRNTITAATRSTVTSVTTADNGRYQLNPALVDVDYWHFSDAVTRRRAATTDHERATEYQRVVDLYSGQLADGIESDWIEAARESIRRDALDAVTALARSTVATSPENTLDLLETARSFDPHNELLYRDIMRLQRRLGRLEAIPRTLSLLTTRLTEIDQTPNDETRILAEALQQQPLEATKRTS
ncbi:BTAD domain-containing putative transcriptional regulator [Kibdelosporangium lantanae]|uniref:BTAD domain-containing putative transcriptional regulator n=1 Tax=Kibdelosporangium lantanae TaxID=1497396 RepID=A0ABW3M3I9_9PSEU